MTVMPRHLAVLVTNYMPEMSEVITAMVERLLVVEFPVTFRDLMPGEIETATLRQCDMTLKDRLKSPEGQSVTACTAKPKGSRCQIAPRL